MTRPETKRLWTYEEMAAELPETNLPTELWDGEIIMSAARFALHQRVVLRLARLLDDFVSEPRIGEAIISPIDVVLAPRKVVQPDVVFVSAARQSMIQGPIRGVPDLLVEVISEGTWRRDRIDKKALYEQFGVTEYWIIEPEARLIEVFTLEAGAYRLHARGADAERVASKLLASFEVSFAQLHG